MTLEEKQAELREKSERLRSETNRKNASGRRKIKKAVPIRWSAERICKDIASDPNISAQYRIDALAMLRQMRGKEPYILPYQKKAKESDDPKTSVSDQSGFSLRGPELISPASKSGQDGGKDVPVDGSRES